MQLTSARNAFALTRRRLLGGGLGSLIVGNVQADPFRRVAVLDWAMFETLLALDIVPVAATELVQFHKVAVEPPVPSQVADLGLRGSPNFEMLLLTRPDLIVSSGWYAWVKDSLERIAPVASYSVYETGRPPYAPAEQVTLALGNDLGRRPQAEAYVAAASDEIGQASRRIADKARPVFLINLGDARHFRVFGPDSMFGDVLQRLGLKNAWPNPTSYAAAAAMPLEALAEVPEAIIAIVSPVPPDAHHTLDASPLWKAIPAVREGRVMTLPPVNPFGALPAARRFARVFSEALSMPGIADG
ncbi:iron-siderophore ABC transporter substrate-binding protein [Microvirga lotononidis]|uniref:ABC-type Fe3+-hydroxamate transport system, periplasmic component n=1 Tax=Microvirga lotononidis TaxID=864069 RepID=I4YL27_9HYPH|nr:iron-siderophore ABC transporter substrate-binding protein [Microvirga lotononidis]EIM24669.1 ABC-type Fe3+-hydroxamate transport system, periplasmic component [Microvirga lotononidis]WQO26683.1 iron-siderophore ABC transporter substrate-binding protein [Microvirga lotononidis]